MNFFHMLGLCDTHFLVTIVVIWLFVLDFKAVSWSNTPFQCAGGVEIGFSQLGGVNHLKYKEVGMTLTVTHWSLYEMANISKYMILKEKAVHFDSNFTECCFWESNWQKLIIDSCNFQGFFFRLGTELEQAFSSASDYSGHWCFIRPR